MSDDLPAWAHKRAQPPEKRPLWVVVLGMAMFFSGSRGLTVGFSELVGHEPGQVSAQTVAGTETLRQIDHITTRRAQAHPVISGVSALARIAVAILTLLAVWAIFSSHARARSAALLAGWAGIAFQPIEATRWLMVFAPDLAELAPLYAELVAREGRYVTQVIPASNMAFAVTMGQILTTLVGFGFSALVLTYFGGRRGRLFFGVGPNLATRQPNHGG